MWLIFAGTPLVAQWDSPPDRSQFSSVPGNPCRDVRLTVTDIAGIAIMGAGITTENQDLELTTDSLGSAAIPCHDLGRNILPVITVRATGYKTRRVNLLPDINSRLEIRMDKSGNLANRTPGVTVNASELAFDVQKQSAQLQQQANRALAGRDYESAEKLLVEAMQITPSDPSVANNLGIIALHKKDVDEAVSWFQKASDEAPYKFEILGNLGLAKWMQLHYEESYTILTKAYAHGYESNLGNYILGTMELRKGESKDALQHLKKTPPNRFPNRDLYLSIALRSCGKQKAADESYRTFLQNNPAPLLASLSR